jgi:Uri superfamily endonuclease
LKNPKGGIGMSEVEVKKEGFLPRISIGDIRELKQQYDLFRKLQQEVLENGIDYGYPAGKRSPEEKPSLYKSGAEKLTRLFNLTPRFELLKVVEEEDFVMYTFKCTLQTQNGFIVGEGFGSCNSREKRHWSENPLANANTILKMAKKRAHVDAVLTGLGASNVFTQDIEDLVEEEPAQKPSKSTKNATQNQLRYLENLLAQLAQKKRQRKEHYIEYIKKAEGVDDLSELSKEKASELIDRIQKALEEPEEIEEEHEVIDEGEVTEDVIEIRNRFTEEVDEE